MNRFFENSNTTSDDLADLLPDYINGHLDADTQARLEKALATDKDLSAQHEFQTRLQIALRGQAESADSEAALNSIHGAPGFAAIADRLEESTGERLLNRFSDWFGLRVTGNFPATALAPAFVLVLAVGLFAGIERGDSETTVDDFRTLTSAETFDQPTLRIITRAGMETTVFAQLLSDYDLNLEQRLPDSYTADVTPVVEGEDLTLLVDALLQDDRVVFAKVVSDRATSDDSSR